MTRNSHTPMAQFAARSERGWCDGAPRNAGGQEFTWSAGRWRALEGPVPSALRSETEPLRGVERLLAEGAAPRAVLAATYEFGRRFDPLGHAFVAEEQDILPELLLLLDEGGDESSPPPPSVNADTHLRSTVGPSAHEAQVEAIRRLISAGDLYQANLAVPFRAVGTSSGRELWERGLAYGGADFAAYLRAGDVEVVSFSPELFVRVRGRRIETRPIKGTARIGVGEGPEDAGARLLASRKDRAEHLMIVDLERNDLGRVCEPGSVRVEPLFEVTVHPTLVHMESTVVGYLREGAGLHDVFAALFPGGSVTGAPKRRALEVIRDIERTPRGIFCGALGWVDARGDFEFNLPIRTATRFADGTLLYPVGGGIVYDSVAADEWTELETKRAFMDRVLAAEGGRAGG